VKEAKKRIQPPSHCPLWRAKEYRRQKTGGKRKEEWPPACRAYPPARKPYGLEAGSERILEEWMGKKRTPVE